MTKFIGMLPAGVEILAMATGATYIVIATSDGPYIVQNDKLEKLQPDFTHPWDGHGFARQTTRGENSNG